MGGKICVACKGVLGGSEQLCPHCGQILNLPMPDEKPSEKPLIIWAPKYELGLRIVDEHHQAIVAIINSIGAALKNGNREKNFNKEIIAKFKGYIVEHFTYEEKLLKASAYPDFLQHKKEHQEFVKKVTEMENAYFNAFFNLREALDFSVKWFLNHIQKEDRRFVEFLATLKKS